MNMHSPTSLRERLRETTREVILDAAETAFAKDGLNRGRVEDVAAIAGVAVGTVYNHFADRGALVKVLLERRREESLSLVDRALADLGHAPFASRLEAVLTTMVAYFDTHRTFFSLLLEEEVQRDVSKRLSSTMALVARLETLVVAGVAERALRKEDAGLYPMLLAGMLRGVFVHALHTKTTAPLASTVKPMVRLFLEGAAP